jgi:hypothetical protein
MMAEKRWLLVCVAFGLACSDSTGPEWRQESQLEFVRFPATPQVETLEASFWAVKGQDRELVIRYLPDGPGDGDEFLEFLVPGESLLRRPDGSLFAEGDSVEITVQLSADGRFLVDMQPSGLRFDPEHPAELEVNYLKLDGDLNGDGVVDQHDDDLRDRLQVWKQERPGDPWRAIGTIHLDDLEQIKGEITGFTGFCIAG